MKMKFGTLYSYWGTKWQCDYLKTLKRVSDIGFDILEMGAPHLLEMSDYELSELRRAAKDMDMVLTANIGPAKDKDLASPDPDIRKAGVNYLIDILKAMEKVGSKSLVGASILYGLSESSRNIFLIDPSPIVRPDMNRGIIDIGIGMNGSPK